MAQSPGIITNELTIIPTSPTLGVTLPVIVGGATKGAVGQPTLLTSETGLIETYGEPLADDFGLLASVEYLKQGTQMFYLRVADGTELASTVDAPGPDGIAATGSISISGPPNDGDNVVISDGVLPAVTFEFDVAIGASGTLTQSGQPTATDTLVIDDGVNPATTFEFDDALEASGTLVISGGQPTDGDTFRVSDGTNQVDFEFDNDSSVTQSQSLRQVVIGATLSDTLNNLQAAINSALFTFDITADAPTLGTTVAITNDNPGVAGNVAVIELVNVSTFLSSTGMTGGNDLTAGGGNIAVRIGADAEGSLDALIAAITNAPLLAVTATKGSATVINLINDAVGTAGNVAMTNGLTNYVEVGMAGGTDAGVGGGNVAVAVGSTDAITIENLRQAINAQSFQVTALPGAGSICSLTNTDAIGATGNVTITGTDTAVVQTLAGMGSGVNAGTTVGMTITAITPGTWGNDLAVVFKATQISGAAPGAFDMDVIAPVGTSGATQVVETFFNLSTTSSDANFIETLVNTGVVNQSNPSKYVNVTVTLDQTPAAGTLVLGTTVSGTNGISGLADADYIGTATGTASTGLQALRNAESVQFNLLAIPGITTNAVILEAINVCESRQDAMYVIDSPPNLTIAEVTDWHNGTSVLPSAPLAQLDSSYAVMYWSHPTTASLYLNQNVKLPPSAFVLAQYALADRQVGHSWRAVAGAQRGKIDALSVEFSPDLTQRNTLLGGSNAVNPIVAFSGDQGIQLFGNETLQRTPGPTDAVHIRRGMIELKRAAVDITRDIQFEPNDPQTWRNIEQKIQPLLDFLVGVRAIEPGAKVVSNSDTNPPSLQAQKTVNAQIFIKPIGAAETLILDFVMEAIGAGSLSIVNA
jgi:hypothetical protein